MAKKNQKEFNYSVGDIVFYVSPINFHVSLVTEVDKKTGYMSKLRSLEFLKGYSKPVDTEHPEWYRLLGRINGKNTERIIEEWKKWTHNLTDGEAAKLLPIIYKQGLLNC